MSDKKYIFFDIDGTLIDKQVDISASTRKALDLAKRNGHEIFLCTGRSEHIIPDAVLDLGFNGVVGGTGTFVEYEGEKIFEKYFDDNQNKIVLDFMTKNSIPFLMCTQKVTVAPKDSVNFFLQDYTGGNVNLDNLDDVLNNGDKKFAFLKSLLPFAIDDDIDNYFSNYKNTSNFVFDSSPISAYEMQDLFGNGIHCEKASYRKPDDYSGEITIEACNKARGISILMDHLGKDAESCIGIGDGYNDLQMLDYCGISIAMGNAPDDVKKEADFVTDDIFHDGIFNALKHFEII